MKILLDECVTHKLKNSLINFEVFTVSEMGWSGLKNGKLMKVAIDSKFDVLITIDKNIEFQQNLNKYPIVIAVFDVEKSKLEYLNALVPKFKSDMIKFKKGNAYRISN